MDIDLTKYTETELIELNRRIVDRIKALRSARCRSTMAEFQVGDRVSFQPECGQEVVATIIRLNRKTVTVVTVEGVEWRVAPGFLKAEASVIEDGRQNLFDLVTRKQRERGRA